MASHNDITGDAIKTKGVTTDQFRSNWDMIFGKQQETKQDDKADQEQVPSGDCARSLGGCVRCSSGI